MSTYVFAHKDMGVDGSEIPSEDRDLLGGNVVDIDEQDLVVLAAQVLKFFPLNALGDFGFLDAGSLWHISRLIQY